MDEYKNILSTDEEINLEGNNVASILQEFDKIYKSINEAKDTTTPQRTIIKKNNLKPTSKFKRLSKILDRYYQTLTTTGNSDHLDTSIRNVKLMLIQEGNICKEIWWQNQIEKVEMAAKCNTKFWRHIHHLSGEKRHQHLH